MHQHPVTASVPPPDAPQRASSIRPPARTARAPLRVLGAACLALALSLPGAALAGEQFAVVRLIAPGTQQIEFLTHDFSWSFGTPPPTASATGGPASALALNPLTVVKSIDAYSTFLFNSATTGRQFRKLTLDVYNGASTLVLTLTFEDVYVSSIAHYGADMTREAVSFRYRSVTENIGMSTSNVAALP